MQDFFNDMVLSSLISFQHTMYSVVFWDHMQSLTPKISNFSGNQQEKYIDQEIIETTIQDR
jgi:hypothetical protein